VTTTNKPLEGLASLFEAILAHPGEPTETPTRLNAILLAAELAAQLDETVPKILPDLGTGNPIALLAAHLDGGLGLGERRQIKALLAASPAQFQDAFASLAYLEDIAADRSSAPVLLLDAAIAGLTQDSRLATPGAEDH
jgi:hypothetical protein